MAKNKSTNSMAELLLRANKNISKIELPKNNLQTIDESKILRPYLEPESKEDNFIEKEDSVVNYDLIKTAENKLVEKCEKSGRKLVENWIQTRSKVDQNLRQSRDKPKTNLRQSRDKVETQPETTFESRDKVETTFSTLTGLQRKLALFIYDECKLNRSEITKGLSLKYIEKILSCPISSIKKTVQRLIQKGIINRISFKDGRGGWVTYGIPDLVFNEILIHEETEYKPSTNGVKCSNFEQKPETQPETSLSSSSSIYNITTTNFSLDPQKSDLPEIWQKVDIDILQKIGFSESHLKQLVDKNIPECVEESIKHFAFGLLHNPKTKQYSDPLNVLMGVLRKGQAWVESNYKSQLEITAEEFLQRKKQETERIVKLKDSVFFFEFENWKNNISHEDKKTITSRGDKNVPDKVKLRLHFKNEIWPEKKKDHELTKDDPE